MKSYFISMFFVLFSFKALCVTEYFIDFKDNNFDNWEIRDDSQKPDETVRIENEELVLRSTSTVLTRVYYDLPIGEDYEISFKMKKVTSEANFDMALIQKFPQRFQGGYRIEWDHDMIDYFRKDIPDDPGLYLSEEDFGITLNVWKYYKLVKNGTNLKLYYGDTPSTYVVAYDITDEAPWCGGYLRFALQVPGGEVHIDDVKIRFDDKNIFHSYISFADSDSANFLLTVDPGDPYGYSKIENGMLHLKSWRYVGDNYGDNSRATCLLPLSRSYMVTFRANKLYHAGWFHIDVIQDYNINDLFYSIFSEADIVKSIKKFDDGWTVLQGNVKTIGNNRWQCYKFLKQGNRLKLYIGDSFDSLEMVLDVVDDNDLLGGHLRFRVKQAGSEVYIDDLNIYSVVLTEDDAVPVELSNLSALAHDNEVQIRWTTLSESNNYGFDIEKKCAGSPGEGWQKIGFIRGNSTTNEENNYSFEYYEYNCETVNIRLKQIDFDGSYTYSDEIVVQNNLPTNFEIQNYPNPFNSQTTIRFKLPASQDIRIDILNLKGEFVRTLYNGICEAGIHKVMWDGRDEHGNQVPSSLYLYSIATNELQMSRKMILLR